jgi:large conductance mechanosensitive channel
LQGKVFILKPEALSDFTTFGLKSYKALATIPFFVVELAKDDEMLEELKQIRTLLEPKPAPPAPPAPKGLWGEFINFLSTYKVMGLAVAFIMGVYLGGLVNALVKDLVMPIIGLAIPGLGNLATFKVPIPGLPVGAYLDTSGNPLNSNGTPLATSQWSGQIFSIGDFVAALITFVIVAFVIFLLVKVTKKWGIQ